MLAVYHGRQSNQHEYEIDGRAVYFYPNSYITNGGELVTRVFDSSGTNVVRKEFSITDHLGSVRSVVYNEGDSLAIKGYDYKPFGEESWSQGGSNEKGFSSSVNEIEQRYKWFGARQYDAKLGRFLSVDPLFEMFPEHSPYHYANNSPISFCDPSGLALQGEPDVEKGYTIDNKIWMGRKVQSYRAPTPLYWGQDEVWQWKLIDFGSVTMPGNRGEHANKGANPMDGKKGNPSSPGKLENAEKKKTTNYSNVGSSGNAGNKVNTNNASAFAIPLDNPWMIPLFMPLAAIVCNPVTVSAVGIMLLCTGDTDERTWELLRAKARAASKPRDRSKPIMHHIATDKYIEPEPYWTDQFRRLFNRVGLDLDDPTNIIPVYGHYGPHPQAYHQEVYDRLERVVNATEGFSLEFRQAVFRFELSEIGMECATPGTMLNLMLTMRRGK